jgi:HEXXH motif-containing protein
MRRIGERSSVDSAYLHGLAASAAIVAGAACSAQVPVRRGRRVLLPFLGQVVIDGHTATATVRIHPAGSVDVIAGSGGVPLPPDPRASTGRWHGIRRLSVSSAGLSTSFLVDDLDPYRHPGARASGRLDSATYRRWGSATSNAWALLTTHHPDAAAEISLCISTLVPLASRQGHEMSASSRHSFGAIALSLPSASQSLAATLAHERQHNKLNALLDLVTLVDDSDSRRWHAPWRDDPRPLLSLLHGAYAHLGVAAFWRRQGVIDTGPAARLAHARFAKWRDSTRQVIEILRTSNALTCEGVRFADGMSAQLDAWT